MRGAIFWGICKVIEVHLRGFVHGCILGRPVITRRGGELWEGGGGVGFAATLDFSHLTINWS